MRLMVRAHRAGLITIQQGEAEAELIDAVMQSVPNRMRHPRPAR